MVAVTAGIQDPRKTFVALTWNVGSLKDRMDDVVGLLVRSEPHILCLQEAKDTAGAVGVLRPPEQTT